MCFVAVESTEAQASAAIFRTRDLLVRQRTLHIDAMQGQLAEHGPTVGKGPALLPRFLAPAEAESDSLPGTGRHAMIRGSADMVNLLDELIGRLDQEIRRRAREEDVPARLMTIPGIWPIGTTALAALAPPAEASRKGRDFAAWVGLTPLQRSTGGKRKLRAGANARLQTAHAGPRGLRQKDGAYCRGLAGQKRA